jgi:starch phosphorylase
MEIAIHPSMPTYSGGLGVLAGDTLRSAADLGIPLIAFTLLHRKGYFQQHLDRTGFQSEEVQPWNPDAFCTEEAARVTVSVEDRVVTVRAWRYDMKGRSGHVVPIYLLDTDVDGNSGWDRGLTDHLYGGDTNYRLQQEIVLGMGGSRMAHALGYRVNVYHMNEGHAALLTLALLERQLGGGPLCAATEADIDMVRRKCVFTTHTPVPAGHDRFSIEQSIRILGGDRTARLEKLGCFRDGLLNMTLLALRFSRYANGVAMQHGKVSREMFPEFPIDNITNGVHAPTWMSEPMQQLLDEHIPSWRRDSDSARPRQRSTHHRGSHAHRPGARFKGAHTRLCPPRSHLQARQPALHRSRTATEDCYRGGRIADSLRRQSSPAGRARQAADPGSGGRRR